MIAGILGLKWDARWGFCRQPGQSDLAGESERVLKREERPRPCASKNTREEVG
jgi:hypothetical protein